MRKWLVIAVPYVWMFLFFLIPFFIVFKISLSESEISIPPYTPVFDIFEGWEAIRAKIGELDFEKYSFIFSDELYTSAYWSSIKIAAVSTFLTLLIAYPLAYGMARAPREWQPTLMMFVILPFWTSFLIRVYAWIGILKNEGLLNALLLNLGLISEPLTIMNTTTAVYIGIVYSYLPFMVLPLYASLEKIRWTASRSGGGPGIAAVEGVLAGDVPAFHSGNRGGLLPRLHSSSGRVRYPGPARRIGDTDDR